MKIKMPKINLEKINKNIILFYSISFVRSIVLGMLQYFLRSHLQDQWVSLEKIAWYISLWMALAYLVWWALSRTFKKRNLTIFFAITSIISISFFFFLDLIPLNVFMILISIIWFSYGIWAVIKHIILSFEIQNSGIRETIINGILSVCVLIWALIWSYFWLKAFQLWWINGYFLIIWFLIISILMTAPLKYDKSFRRKKIKESLNIFIPEIKLILRKYYRLLIPIWILRSISVWFVQKVFYLWTGMFGVAPGKAVFIYVYSVIWAIIWFTLSAIFYKKKKLFIIIATIFMALILTFFLRFVSWFPSYMILEVSTFVLGIFFGVLVNILEWRYFWHIGRDHDKEYGSAIYGIVVSVLNFTMMIIADFLLIKSGMKSTFIFFGILLFATLFLYRHFDKEHYAFEEKKAKK